ncbi:putative universal stress protein family protein [Lyophyllum shimeji]|uniref:Universal stress protein family protein n=1 Tax=Lyophyllum shimeji TaxID=47721 RepID=A0A9P3UKT1_LYOSH|nr:putative universal stress protein family protein [Lyophyllum shimeji]
MTEYPKAPRQTLDNETSPNGTSTAHQSSPTLSFKSTENNHRASGSFKSFTSRMGGFPSLSLSRTNTRDNGNGNGDDKESRGRTMAQTKRGKSASQAPGEADSSRSRSRARSTSPFSFRRFRQREPSPVPEAIPLAQSDVDLSDSAPSVRPRTTAFSYDSGDETVGEETEEEDWSDDDYFDPVTERNTERNAVIAPPPPDSGFAGGEAEADVDPDPLGEGVNVVVPPEPYFPSTLNRTKKGPRRRKSTKHHEPLPYETSRPIFQRDRCTITLTQGDPEGKLGERRKRKYMVASDLSEESRYAVEWAIGTVLRDGDELLMVTVTENEAKVDPPIPNAADRTTKLRAQQERQGLAYILLRQATSLLQRTKLNVKVACQAWHAKSARRMLLDIVDYTEPTMVIVGSRGLGQLKGILLGSTSHYLIQKCSVPVMVARRRLKRPARRSAHLSTHRRHVSLAEAGIDRVAPKVDEDVQVMREEIKRDDDRRDGGPGSRDTGARMPVEWKEEDVEEADEDENDEAVDAKVASE